MIASLGTHNLHDGEAPGTEFADVIFFTEADPDKLRRELGDDYRLFVCRWQRDLVIAIRKTMRLHDVHEHYRLAHPGVPLVTPHRGTYWLTCTLQGDPNALLDEHRINAAFPPFKRGEGRFRRLMWRRHTRLTGRIVRRLDARGYEVQTGGDLNTLRKIDGYPDTKLHEWGTGFDRIGSTEQWRQAEQLPGVEAVHPRLVVSR